MKKARLARAFFVELHSHETSPQPSDPRLRLEVHGLQPAAHTRFQSLRNLPCFPIHAVRASDDFGSTDRQTQDFTAKFAKRISSVFSTTIKRHPRPGTSSCLFSIACCLLSGKPVARPVLQAQTEMGLFIEKPVSRKENTSQKEKNKISEAGRHRRLPVARCAATGHRNLSPVTCYL